MRSTRLAAALAGLIGAGPALAQTAYLMDAMSDRAKVSVANQETNEVVAIPAAGNRMVAHIPIDIAPQTLIITPDGGKVYVSNVTGGASLR